MQDEVIFTEDNGVGVITLNRPDRLNALTYSMVQKINKNLNSWEINDNINCIIIEGAGGVMVPLNYKGNMIVELASMFEAKVIIVFKNYLGSINHTSLTIDKVKSVGLDILGLLVVGDEVTSSERIIEDATQMNIIARIPIVDRVNQKWVKEQGLKVKNKLDKFL